MLGSSRNKRKMKIYCICPETQKAPSKMDKNNKLCANAMNQAECSPEIKISHETQSVKPKPANTTPRQKHNSSMFGGK